MKLLSPSILSSDFSDLKSQIRILELGNADWIHLDIMDGHFVPNFTFGPILVDAINKITDLTLDVHLMITNPDNFIERFAEAGADLITVHKEAVIHIHRTLNSIKNLNKKSGLAINPGTSLSEIEALLDYVDLVLIMSVNPGFGGQKFIQSSIKKISRLKEIKEKNNYSFLIEVDGGIGLENIDSVLDAGADVIVAGASIFKSADPVQQTIELKKLILNYQNKNEKK